MMNGIDRHTDNAQIVTVNNSRQMDRDGDEILTKGYVKISGSKVPNQEIPRPTLPGSLWGSGATPLECARAHPPAKELSRARARPPPLLEARGLA
jgi:hypothetical protein